MSAAPGHNSGIAGERLKSFIARIERLEEERSGLGEDIKGIYQECKSDGFDTKVVRQIVRLRKVEIEKRREQEELLDLYESAIAE